MSDELLRETNDLMKRLLELREQDLRDREIQKQETAKQMQGFEASRMAEEFKFPDMGDFQVKHEAKMEDIKLRADEAQAREVAYREELLGQLKKQNELLERIAVALVK